MSDGSFSNALSASGMEQEGVFDSASASGFELVVSSPALSVSESGSVVSIICFHPPLAELIFSFLFNFFRELYKGTIGSLQDHLYSQRNPFCHH